MELHQQVRQARKDARLTQSALADLAQVGRKDISRFENGENVTMKTFLRIVGALPNLKRLYIGPIELSKELPQPDIPAQTAPPSEPVQPRQQALLRSIAQLLIEIAGTAEQAGVSGNPD